MKLGIRKTVRKPVRRRRSRSTSIRLPVDPVDSYAFSPVRGALRASGSPARDGDIVAELKSLDGKRTVTAVGSPVMRHRSYLGGNHKFIELDGASGFACPLSATAESLAEGTAVAGFKMGNTTGKNSIFGTSNNTTTTSLLSFFQQQAASGLGQAIHGLMKGGLTTDVLTSPPGKSGGRHGTFSHMAWLGDVDYRLFNKGRISLQTASSNNGAWINRNDSFEHTDFTIGFLRRTSDIFFATGDFAYCGLFPLMSEAKLQQLNQFYERLYPSTLYYFLGDSRVNTTNWLEFESVNQFRNRADNFHENATGGHQVANCLADWLSDSFIQPDFVCIYVGINDIIADRLGSDIADDFDALVDAVVSRPGLRRVYLFNETPFGGADEHSAARQTQLDILRARIAQKAAATPKAELFDSYGIMDDPANPGHLRVSDHIGDGLHISATGMNRMADGFGNVEGWPAAA